MYHLFLALNFSIFTVKYIYAFRIIFHNMHSQTNNLYGCVD